MIMQFTGHRARVLALLLCAGGLSACVANEPSNNAVPQVVGSAASGAAQTLAAQRLQAIGRGDVQAIVQGYGENATLNWVGGPLDGTYRGTEQLASVWQRFVTAQGPMRVMLGAAVEGANPRGATVITPVAFVGDRTTVKVRHVVVLRGGRVVNETWQVDPALAV